MTAFLVSLIPGGGATVAGWLVAFLAATVTALVDGFAAEVKRNADLVDRGAADQRAADDAAETAVLDRARKIADETHNADDRDLDRELDRWVRPGP